MKNLKTANRAFTLVEIMIVVLIIGILLAIAVPNFIRAREQSRAKSCSANLKQFDSAKEQWAMDKKKNEGDTVTFADIVGATLYIKALPQCPSNSAAYLDTELGKVSTNPTCTINTTTAPKGYYHTFNAQP